MGNPSLSRRSLEIPRAIQTNRHIVTTLEKQPEVLASELPRLAGNVAGCKGQRYVLARFGRGQVADGPHVRAQGMGRNRPCQHSGSWKAYQL